MPFDPSSTSPTSPTSTPRTDDDGIPIEINDDDPTDKIDSAELARHIEATRPPGRGQRITAPMDAVAVAALTIASNKNERDIERGTTTPRRKR